MQDEASQHLKTIINSSQTEYTFFKSNTIYCQSIYFFILVTTIFLIVNFVLKIFYIEDLYDTSVNIKLLRNYYIKNTIELSESYYINLTISREINKLQFLKSQNIIYQIYFLELSSNYMNNSMKYPSKIFMTYIFDRLNFGTDNSPFDFNFLDLEGQINSGSSSPYMDFLISYYSFLPIIRFSFNLNNITHETSTVIISLYKNNDLSDFSNLNNYMSYPLRNLQQQKKLCPYFPCNIFLDTVTLSQGNLDVAFVGYQKNWFYKLEKRFLNSNDSMKYHISTFNTLNQSFDYQEFKTFTSLSRRVSYLDQSYKIYITFAHRILDTQDSGYEGVQMLEILNNIGPSLASNITNYLSNNFKDKPLIVLSNSLQFFVLNNTSTYISYDISDSIILKFSEYINNLFKSGVISVNTINDTNNIYVLPVDYFNSYRSNFIINPKIYSRFLIFDYAYFMNLYGIFQHVSQTMNLNPSLLMKLFCSYYDLKSYYKKSKPYIDCFDGSYKYNDNNEIIQCFCIPFYCYDYKFSSLSDVKSYLSGENQTSPDYKNSIGFPSKCNIETTDDYYTVYKKHYSIENQCYSYLFLQKNPIVKEILERDYIESKTKTGFVYSIITIFLTIFILSSTIYFTHYILRIKSKILNLSEIQIKSTIDICKSKKEIKHIYQTRHALKKNQDIKNILSFHDIMKDTKKNDVEIDEFETFIEENSHEFSLEFNFQKIFKISKSFTDSFKTRNLMKIKFIFMENLKNNDLLIQAINKFENSTSIIKEISSLENFGRDKYSYNFFHKIVQNESYNSKKSEAKNNIRIIRKLIEINVNDNNFENLNKSILIDKKSVDNFIEYYNDKIFGPLLNLLLEKN